VRYSPDDRSGFSETEKYYIGNILAAYQFTPALLEDAGCTHMKASADTSAAMTRLRCVLITHCPSALTSTPWRPISTRATRSRVYDEATSTRTTQAAQASIGSYGYTGTNHLMGIHHWF
jgi:hypothetical protein